MSMAMPRLVFRFEDLELDNAWSGQNVDDVEEQMDRCHERAREGERERESKLQFAEREGGWHSICSLVLPKTKMNRAKRSTRKRKITLTLS
jgi:hypothetical protein